MWDGSRRSVSIVIRICRSSMCDSFRWAIRMAAGREARHCHSGGKEGTPGLWQCWGHAAPKDWDRMGTSRSPRREPCAGAQAGTALGQGGFSTPWDPAEAAGVALLLPWDQPCSHTPRDTEGSPAGSHRALPPSSRPQGHPGEAAQPLHPTGSAPPQDSEAQPISILPLKVPSFPLPRAELSLGQLWAAGKSIPAEPCPWD